MKHISKKLCKAILTVGVLLLIGCFTSCINDDQSDCGLNLRFRYTYNVKDANAFGSEVKRVKILLFDKDGVYRHTYFESHEKFDNDYIMTIPNLPKGKYTIVCLAGNKQEISLTTDFKLDELQEGKTTLKEVNARLQRPESNISNTDITALYDGWKEIEVNGGPQTETIDLMKCTKNYRIVIMPYDSEDNKTFDAKDFDIRIEGSAAWLDYQARKFKVDPIIYRPFSQTTSSADTKAGGEVTKAVIADISSSRIFRDGKPKLIIDDQKTGKELLNIDLAWFLSLQGIGEHRSEWSDQEYLDRQDYYSMTFFVNRDKFMMGHIVVNGWVLSLDNPELQ